MNKMNVFKRACMIGLFALSFGAHAANMLVGSNNEFNYIKFTGEIVRGDGKKFERIVNQSEAKGKPIDIVLLNSPGGILSESYDIIDVILDNEISTVVKPGARCISACVGIFAAGDERILYPTSKVGVHRARSGDEDNDQARGSSIDLMEVYKDLDIPDSIRLKMIETAPDEVYYLTTNEMREFTSDESPFDSPKRETVVQRYSMSKSTIHTSETTYTTESVTAAGDFDQMAIDLKEEGLNFIKARQYDDAISVLSKAHNIKGENADIVYFLGHSYFQKGNYGTAKKYYVKALGIDPNHSAAWRGYGFTQAKAGDVDGATNSLIRYWQNAHNKALATNAFFEWEREWPNTYLAKAAKKARKKLDIVEPIQ